MDDQQLKIHIERIVRPIRATAPRKLRMRRELLTHLKFAFAEECSASPDQTTALARALERLGDPARLRAEFQRSVPWPQRILLARLPGVALNRLERKAGI